ncbi:MAG: hypothetical protein P8M11_09150 [Planctomycetota bacterium]|nr:hypothetical protein [Planctomycetota bacterium]MDG1984723.1 hypothetical protein [Planctomycetota bacterium]
MASTWSISRRQARCAETEREFGEGERHVSLLTVVEGALQRADLSLDAWGTLQAKIESGETAAPLFHWFTRHQVERKKTVQLDFESLDRLFLELEGREELQVRELRYVLCLLLMRKRRVKVEKILREGDEEAFLVKRPRDDRRYKVFVYDFEADRLDEVRAQLQAVFDGAEGPHGIRLGLDDGDLAEDAAEAEASPAESAGDPDPEASSAEGGVAKGDAPVEA